MTKNKILNKIKKEFNILEVNLIKVEGIWYWSGSITEFWSETCTHNISLNDCSLELWTQDFKEKYTTYN